MLYRGSRKEREKALYNFALSQAQILSNDVLYYETSVMGDGRLSLTIHTVVPNGKGDGVRVWERF